MLRHSETAVIARNQIISGVYATEPFEAGWAIEAIVFVTALKGVDTSTAISGRAWVQISPDGMRWIDEGTRFDVVSSADAVSIGRIQHFGNWLRVLIEMPLDAQTKFLVTLHLK